MILKGPLVMENPRCHTFMQLSKFESGAYKHPQYDVMIAKLRRSQGGKARTLST